VAKIGVFNVGFYRYWPQFPGLKERLDGSARNSRWGPPVRRGGGFPPAGGHGGSGRRAGSFRRAERGLDFLRRHHLRAVGVRAAGGRSGPRRRLVLVGLQPTPGMDPARATTSLQLEHDNCTSLPEISYALKRAGWRPRWCSECCANDEQAWARSASGPWRRGRPTL